MFTPDSPQPGTVPVPSTQPLAAIFITSIMIKLNVELEAGTNILVEWSEGAIVDGHFVQSRAHMSQLHGPALLTKMNEEVTAGLSHYEDFKQAVYELMQQQGMLPPGTIS